MSGATGRRLRHALLGVALCIGLGVAAAASALPRAAILAVARPSVVALGAVASTEPPMQTALAQPSPGTARVNGGSLPARPAPEIPAHLAALGPGAALLLTLGGGVVVWRRRHRT